MALARLHFHVQVLQRIGRSFNFLCPVLLYFKFLPPRFVALFHLPSELFLVLVGFHVFLLDGLLNFKSGFHYGP